MRYATIHHTWLRTSPAVEAPDAALGTWLRLSAWCADNETGRHKAGITRRRPLGEAVVSGCKKWKPRAWIAATGTTREHVEAMIADRLGRWEGEDLVLFGYDVHAQKVYAGKRKENEAQAAGQEPEQAAGQVREDQRRADRSGAYRRESSPGQGDPREEVPPQDDDGAPNCAGDVVEHDEEEILALVASIGSRLARGLP